jgi:uncharacterized membrane protein
MIIPLVLTGLIWAQPPEGEGPRAQIEALYIWRLTEALKLNEDQVTELLPKLQALRQENLSFQRARRETLKELAAHLKSERCSEQSLREYLDRLKRQEREHQAKVEGLRGEIAGILSLEQQARLLVFQAEFEQQVRELIQKMRGRHRPPRP